MGISITYDLLQELGYKIIRQDPLRLDSEFDAGMFQIDVETKYGKYFICTVGYGASRTMMEKELNERKAFRASVFIQKYQQNYE